MRKKRNHHFNSHFNPRFILSPQPQIYPHPHHKPHPNSKLNLTLSLTLTLALIFTDSCNPNPNPNLQIFSLMKRHEKLKMIHEQYLVAQAEIAAVVAIRACNDREIEKYANKILTAPEGQTAVREAYSQVVESAKQYNASLDAVIANLRTKVGVLTTTKIDAEGREVESFENAVAVTPEYFEAKTAEHEKKLQKINHRLAELRAQRRGEAPPTPPTPN
jgi:hypothetical protein